MNFIFIVTSSKQWPKSENISVTKISNNPKKPDSAGFGNDTLDPQYFEHMFPLSDFVWAVGYLFFLYLFRSVLFCYLR